MKGRDLAQQKEAKAGFVFGCCRERERERGKGQWGHGQKFYDPMIAMKMFRFGGAD